MRIKVENSILTTTIDVSEARQKPCVVNIDYSHLSSKLTAMPAILSFSFTYAEVLKIQWYVGNFELSTKC